MLYTMMFNLPKQPFVTADIEADDAKSAEVQGRDIATRLKIRRPFVIFEHIEEPSHNMKECIKLYVPAELS